MRKSKFIHKYQRHEKHVKAFDALTINIFFEFIIAFLNDEKIHYTNNDDLELFLELTFNSKFRLIHSRFIKYLLNNDNNLFVISKYLKYMSEQHYLVSDFFNNLFRDYPIIIIEKIFDIIPRNLKLLFLNDIKVFPEIIQQIPSIKLYMVFS